MLEATIAVSVSVCVCAVSVSLSLSLWVRGWVGGAGRRWFQAFRACVQARQFDHIPFSNRRRRQLSKLDGDVPEQMSLVEAPLLFSRLNRTVSWSGAA